MRALPRSRRCPSSVLTVVWLAVAHAASAQPAIDLRSWRVVDLTHPFDERTVYWPTSPSAFELKTLSEGQTPGGFYYSSYALCTPEHGGTHLDAPGALLQGGSIGR